MDHLAPIDPDAIVSCLPAPSGAAVFLDFDGTLVDLAARPDAIVVPPGLAGLLADLGAAVSGALALVSGRAIDDIAAHLPGFAGTVSGGHGAELRIGGAITRHPAAASDELGAALAIARGAFAPGDGILIEEKPTGLVLHYRQAPQMAGAARDLALRLAERFPVFEHHASKMAEELRPRGIGKDRAVAGMLDRAPFAGRVPVVFGDDATDEPAMALAQDRGGIAIKVGEGRSRARLRAEDPATVLRVLENWIGRETT